MCPLFLQFWACSCCGGRRETPRAGAQQLRSTAPAAAAEETKEWLRWLREVQIGAPGAGGCSWGQEPLEAPLQAVPQLLQLSLGGWGASVDPTFRAVLGVGLGAGPCQCPAPWYHLPSWGGQQCGGHTQEAVIGFKAEPFGATNQFLQGLCWAVSQMPIWAATSCVSSCRHRPGTKLGPVLAIPKARGQRSRTDPAPTQPQRRTEQH